MAVAYHNGTSNIDASTSAATVPWLVPASPTAGEIWICSAVFRGGSGATISGVHAGFNLIQRVDSGSGSTNCTVVCYWYEATGTESGTLGTITLSGASRHFTITDAFSGCNLTTPIVSGSINTTTNAGTGIVPSAFTLGQADYGFFGTQGGSAVTPMTGIGSPTPTATEDGNASGGSQATDVQGSGGYTTTSTGYSSPSWTGGGIGVTTGAGMGFTLDAAAAASSYVPPSIHGMSQAVHRAAHFFSRVPWHEKRPSGLIVPDLVVV